MYATNRRYTVTEERPRIQPWEEVKRSATDSFNNDNSSTIVVIVTDVLTDSEARTAAEMILNNLIKYYYLQREAVKVQKPIHIQHARNKVIHVKISPQHRAANRLRIMNSSKPPSEVPRSRASRLILNSQISLQHIHLKMGFP